MQASKAEMRRKGAALEAACRRDELKGSSRRESQSYRVLDSFVCVSVPICLQYPCASSVTFSGALAKDTRAAVAAPWANRGRIGYEMGAVCNFA